MEHCKQEERLKMQDRAIRTVAISSRSIEDALRGTMDGKPGLIDNMRKSLEFIDRLEKEKILETVIELRIKQNSRANLFEWVWKGTVTAGIGFLFWLVQRKIKHN